MYSQNIVSTSLSTQEMKNGVALFNERKYTAAIQAFELALSYEPLNHFAKYRLGLAYLYAGYAYNASRIWEELVNIGVADHQVVDQLNTLYFQMSLDKEYNYTDPYIFREYYNGFEQGGHDVFRTSFVVYDEVLDRKFISSTGKSQVVEMDSGNTILHKYGARLFLPYSLEMPMGVALYSNLLYVADYKKNKIVAFNRNILANVAFSFGETGSLSNQMLGPMGLFFDDDYLYVVDNGNNRIQKYLPDGTHVYAFGENYLYRPTDIVVHSNMLYVSDIDQNKNGRIVQFDEDGNFVQNIGVDFLKEPRGLYLDGDELYISDSAGELYIYHTESQRTRSFSNGDRKLVAPFDVIKDKDQILWRTDFNSEKIAIYTPLQGVYGNINLEISQILTDNYPYIYALVRARNKDGTPLTGITKDEISITEFDLPVQDILVDGISNYRSNMLITFVIDKSSAMSTYTPQLEYYLKSFISNMTGNDKLEVVLVDDKLPKRSGKNTASISQSWNFITNYQAISPVPNSWDVPIYDAVTGLLNNFRNRAVVVFTSGEASLDAFSTYGSDVLKTYADQNSIPIYVINFSNENQEFWKKIATGSHGKYLQAKNNASEIIDLYTIIKNSSPLEYLVEYNGYNYKDVPDLWVDVVLKLERFGLSGSVASGYYVPFPDGPDIDLQESFFSTIEGQ